MKFSSPIFAKASGSINGMTFSHNKGGQYVRCRNMPTNPNSCLQIASRAAFGNLVQKWVTDLSGSERDSWDEYADNVPKTNSIGNEIYISGQNWFIGSNLPRVKAGLAPISAAPTTFNTGDAGTFSLAGAFIGSTTDITIDTPGDWAGNDAGRGFVYQSEPVNGSRNFVPPRFRLVKVVSGNTATPETSISISASELAWPNVDGQKYRIKIRGNAPDGRLSQETELCVEEYTA